MASAAIPGIFPPVDWDGRKLIDGGVSNNTPIADAIELGAERIYVLPTGNACDLTTAPRGALGMFLHAMSLLIMRRLLVEVELLGRPGRADRLTAPMSAEHHADRLLQGRRADQPRLRRRRRLPRRLPRPDRSGAPLAMTMHDHRRARELRS